MVQEITDIKVYIPGIQSTYRIDSDYGLNVYFVTANFSPRLLYEIGIY